jgi:hypothetical protein
MGEIMKRIKSVYKKSLYLCLLMLFFLGCATAHEEKTAKPDLQETKSFEGFTPEEIWEAILQSLAEMEFTVRKEIKDSGFIFAQAASNPDSFYLPPHLNIYIRQEANRYSVTCHAVVPGQHDDYEASARYVARFFEILAGHLRSRTSQALC